MKFVVALLLLFFSCKTLGYGIYEYKEQQNKIPGIIIMIFSGICLIAPCMLIFFEL